MSALVLLLSVVCMKPAPVARPHAAVPAHPVWPAVGTITSPFGRDGARWHPGLDIGILRSLRVRAAVPGRVILVGHPPAYFGYGNVVVVRSSKTMTELYAHLAGARVHEGERVRAGERLGTAGCTGVCTGTHLHFEVRRKGRPVSPLRTILRRATLPH